MIAADGGRAPRGGPRPPDRPVGRRRRLARRGRRSPRWPPPASPIRAVAGRQGRVRHRARRPGRRRRRRPADHVARRARRRADRPRPRQRLAARAIRASAGRRRPPRRCRASRIRARRARAGPTSAGRIGDLVSLLPFGGDAAGLTTRGLRYPLRRRAAARAARRAACRTSATPPTPSLDGRIGPAPRRRDPCYALGNEHARRRVTSPPRSPFPTRPARSTAWPTSAAAGRSSTSTRRTTRPAARSRPASSATPTRRSTSAAPTSGGSARRAPTSKQRVPREVRPAVHPPRRRGPRGRRGLRLVGREAELRQDVHGRRPDDVPRRSRTAGSPGPGRRSSPRATPPRCSRPSTRLQAARRRRRSVDRAEPPDSE